MKTVSLSQIERLFEELDALNIRLETSGVLVFERRLRNKATNATNLLILLTNYEFKDKQASNSSGLFT